MKKVLERDGSEFPRLDKELYGSPIDRFTLYSVYSLTNKSKRSNIAKMI